MDEQNEMQIGEQQVPENNDTLESFIPEQISEVQEQTNKETELPPERPLWSLSAQAAADRAAAKKSGLKGALVYAIIMTALFAVCFAILAALLITGFGSDGDERQPIQVGVGADIADLVDNVIDGVVTVSVDDASFGSGFVYTNTGYIITNYHVIDGAGMIQVILQDGSVYPAELVDGDELSDVAVIRAYGLTVPKLPIGDSDELRVGESVIAIGTPVELEYAGTVTYGIISGVKRKVKVYDRDLHVKTMELIQTDATLNHGNSGGPMFNMRGEVIGINTLKHLNLDNGDEMGFAIPINDVAAIADDIIEDGKYSGNKGTTEQGIQLGISIYNVKKDVAVELDWFTTVLPKADGVMIVGIENGSVCKGKAELYDIIVSFDGNTITNGEQIRYELSKHNHGDRVKLGVFRDGETIEIEIVL